MPMESIFSFTVLNHRHLLNVFLSKYLEQIIACLTKLTMTFSGLLRSQHFTVVVVVVVVVCENENRDLADSKLG